MIDALAKAIAAAAVTAPALLRKSQMSFDFNAHHIGYSRIDPRTGKMELIAPKNPHHSGAEASGRQEGKAMTKPIWDTDGAVNDPTDIKRRLIAAGFNRNEWRVRRKMEKNGDIGDASIMPMHPLDSKQVVARTQSLLDAGFDVSWMVAKQGTLNVPLVHSVPRQGMVTIFNADAPVGKREFGKYQTAAEATAALETLKSQSANELTLPSGYENTVDGWKSYITKELRSVSSTTEEKRTGDYNRHLIYDFDSSYSKPESRTAIKELLATGDYGDHTTYNEDGTATIEMWSTLRGEMKRLLGQIVDEETNGNKDVGRKAYSAYMAAYDNAGDSMGGQDRPWREEIYGDAENNPAYHSIAYGSISMVGDFDENPEVQEWFRKHGYSW